MADNVEKIILAVYGTGSEYSRRDAITWLHDFANTAEAWNISFELLRSKAANVQFYASTIVQTKVQKEWNEQQDSFKEDVHGRIVQNVRSYVQDGNGGMSQNALKRLCLILAKITILSPQTIDIYLREVWSFLSVGLGDMGETSSELVKDRALYVATELLRDLPEEKEADVPTTHSIVALHPESIEQRMINATGQVLEAIRRLIQQDKPTYQTKGFECLNAWASSTVNLVALARYNLLVPTIVAIHSSENVDTIEGATQALQSCAKQSTYERQIEQPESDEMIQALDIVVSGILQCRGMIAATNNADNGDDLDAERLALAICKLVVAVAERQIDRVVVGATSDLLALADMIMGLTAHRFRNVAIHTLNFWLMVQDFPLQERHEGLREMCYLNLLQTLLRQAKLDVNDPDDEDDDLISFRECHDGAQEPIVVTFFVLGPKFVQLLHSVLTTTSDWSEFEAALFALNSAGREVVKAAISSSGGPTAQPIKSAIESILLELPNLPLFVHNGPTLRSGVSFVGTYAKMLARMDRSVIERALEYVSIGMGYSSKVSCPAACAFHQVCVSSSLELALYPDGVRALVQRIETIFLAFPSNGSSSSNSYVPEPINTSEVKAPLQARIDFVQAITRVASCMKLKACTETLIVLLNPGLERLRRAIEQVQPNSVVNELEILQAAIKFVKLSQDLESPSMHPVSGILQGTLPILEQIYNIEVLRSHSGVVDALYGLISTSFVSARDVLAPHLESLLSSAILQLQTTWSPCCVTCIGKAVEIFAIKPDYQAGFIEIFARLVGVMITAVSDGHASESPALVSEFFDTVRLFLFFCPRAVFQGPSSVTGGVPISLALLRTASQCLTLNKESNALRSVLIFLSQMINMVINSKRGDDSFRPVLDATIREEGSGLSSRLFVGLAGSVNAALTPNLAQALADLARVYPSAVQEGLYNAMVSNPQYFSSLNASAKEIVVAGIPKIAVSISKAKEVFSELSKICRREIPQQEFLDFLAEAENASLAMLTNNIPPPPKDSDLVDLSNC